MCFKYFNPLLIEFMLGHADDQKVEGRRQTYILFHHTVTPLILLRETKRNRIFTLGGQRVKTLKKSISTINQILKLESKTKPTIHLCLCLAQWLHQIFSLEKKLNKNLKWVWQFTRVVCKSFSMFLMNAFSSFFKMLFSQLVDENRTHYSSSFFGEW